MEALQICISDQLVMIYIFLIDDNNTKRSIYKSLFGESCSNIFAFKQRSKAKNRESNRHPREINQQQNIPSVSCTAWCILKKNKTMEQTLSSTADITRCSNHKAPIGTAFENAKACSQVTAWCIMVCRAYERFIFLISFKII